MTHRGKIEHKSIIEEIEMHIFALTATLVAGASAACDRALLTAATSDLFTAQTSGKLSGNSFGSTIKYTENRKAVNISQGILSQALTINHNRSQHDVVQCAAFSEFIVTNSAKPYVIATQLRLDNATSKVTQIDSIVTTKGDWLFNVTGTYYWASQEKWDPIPEGKRDKREVIKAAADAYCDIFSDKSVKVCCVLCALMLSHCRLLSSIFQYFFFIFSFH